MGTECVENITKFLKTKENSEPSMGKELAGPKSVAMQALKKLTAKADAYRVNVPQKYKGYFYTSPMSKIEVKRKNLYSTLFDNTMATGHEYAAFEMVDENGKILYSQTFTSHQYNMINPVTFNKQLLEGLFALMMINSLDKVRSIVFTHTHPGATGFSNVNNTAGDIPTAFQHKAILEEIGLTGVNFDWVLVRPGFWKSNDYKLESFRLSGELEWRRGDYRIQESERNKIDQAAMNYFIVGLASRARKLPERNETSIP